MAVCPLLPTTRSVPSSDNAFADVLSTLEEEQARFISPVGLHETRAREVTKAIVCSCSKGNHRAISVDGKIASEIVVQFRSTPQKVFVGKNDAVVLHRSWCSGVCVM